VQLEVVRLGSTGEKQRPRSGADLRDAVVVGAGAEDAHEFIGVGEESFHPWISLSPPVPAAIRLVCAGTDRNPSSPLSKMCVLSLHLLLPFLPLLPQTTLL
jgi:hypothetical protein